MNDELRRRNFRLPPRRRKELRSYWILGPWRRDQNVVPKRR